MTWDQLHDEDVLFEFGGDRPDELTPGRFYRGTVDGFADFGVFVTLGESVTGLLHRSNIDGRLENLEWDPGDEVIVQVEGVRENGNVDLAWSIRQSPEEFRGDGIHDPTVADESTMEEDAGDATERTRGSVDQDEPEEAVEIETEPEEEVEVENEPESVEEVTAPSLETRDVADVSDVIGDRLRLTGEITDVRQTNGPTIFTVLDETGEVECAAFEAAGVRAFPEIDTGDAVSLIGRGERHRGSLQVETESIEELSGEDREEILGRIRQAEEERARPEDTDLLISDESIAAHADDFVETATALRRAVQSGRSIVIRHPITVDGVVAGAGLEHALRTLTEKTYDDHEASDWFVTRRPMDESWYDLGDAMYDVTDGADRNDLIVLVGAGASEQDEAARSFLEIYDVAYRVVDPYGTDIADVTPIATNIAAMVDADVRSDLVHLPAIGVGDDAPEHYHVLAADHGYDKTAIEERHEAIALVAYYQQYDDKRELIADLLFDGTDAGDLAAHISGQFRERMETAVETALENGERLEHDDTLLFVLDAATLTHRYAFPPRQLLADILYRETEVDRLLVLDEDAGFVAGNGSIDLDAIAASVNGEVPDAAVAASRDRITFLAGKRPTVRDAVLEELAGIDA